MNHRRIKELVGGGDEKFRLQMCAFFYSYSAVYCWIFCVIIVCVWFMGARINHFLLFFFGLGGRPSPTPSPNKNSVSLIDNLFDNWQLSNGAPAIGLLPIQCKSFENRGSSSSTQMQKWFARLIQEEEKRKKIARTWEKRTEIDRWAIFLLFLLLLLLFFIIILVPSKHRKAQKWDVARTHSLTHFSLLANYSSLQQQQQQHQRMNKKEEEAKNGCKNSIKTTQNKNKTSGGGISISVPHLAQQW